MEDEKLLALIYLWTRDAELPISRESEDYITNNLQEIKKSENIVFSDKARQDMAVRILQNLKEIPVNG